MIQPDRCSKINPFMVMEVLERAQAMEKCGQRVIHLEVGEPDFDTPEPIKEAAIKAIKDGKTGYTHSLGLRELREAIAGYYCKTYQLSDLDPEQVIVTSGTSPAMLLAFAAILEPGDEIIISDPHYACYPNFVKFFRGNPTTIPIYDDSGFQYNVEDIKQKLTSRTKGILINSPSNPTGTLLSEETLKSLSKLDILVLSDEIYHGLTYGEKAHSMLEYTNNCIVFNGFSKLYAMTGWRLGYLIVPKDLIRPIQIMHQNFFISANSISQWAGVAALTEPEVEKYIREMVEIYDRRRKVLIKGLKELGFGIQSEPNGAFYVLANARKFTTNSYDFAFKILEKACVGVTPGIDFGENAEGYIRFAYANSLKNIEEALSRLRQFLKSLN
ncbi:MAG TPA: pyridoxal phosphate-dependent aminotransferase [Deltaproteobacteria bacterium]|nr:pyridoxal phosphate-dependent aminotransferase [Deltaproteobacteria bacterium]